MKSRTYPEYGNCIFSILYLYLRGKCKNVTFVSSHTILFPWHFMSENRSGNIIHFQYIRLIQGAWFLGHYEAIGKRVFPRYIRLNKRREILRINAHLFFWISILPVLVSFVPLFVAFAVYPLFKFSHDTFQAFRRRTR